MISDSLNADASTIDGGAYDIEVHPWAPFLPEGVNTLIAGTFPPAPKRWSMDFFYPNPINDFWRIMGLIFFGDKDALWLPKERKFDLPKIIHMLQSHHIGMCDTGHKVRRLRGNASDKFLEIIEPFDLDGIIASAPSLRAIATTGEKAARVLAELTSTEVPRMGCYSEWNGLKLWRMPSSSRAYPMPIEKKADYYHMLFD